MKRVAITLGDPGGIGPEVALKAVTSKEVSDICTPVLIGDRTVIEEVISKLLPSLSSLKKKSLLGDAEVVDIPAIKSRNFVTNAPSSENGKACVSYIRKAVELATARKVNAIVTAPISKEALRLAGFQWPGHTEMLAEFTGTTEYAMMLAGGPLKVILVTIHTALRNVPELVTRERVLKTIRLARNACNMLGIKDPIIAVAGLNPHAGESGMLGNEEIREIEPAIIAAKKEGMNVRGPYPPDVVFHKAYEGEVDIVVCMYHDQGLIPLKMLAFDKGVNITVGLPIIRTSPDHGTAYDIAWKGLANPSSMIEAIKVAAKIAEGVKE